LSGSTLAPAPVRGPGRPPKRELKRSTRIGLWVVAAMVTAQVLGFGGTYLLFARHYVSTDNAQVDGQRVDINAPVDGTLVDWTLTQGSTIRDDQVLGRVRQVGSGGQPQKVIRSTGAGTIADHRAVEGQYVTAGQTLATGFDMARLYVTARVEDTEIADVRPGAPVDISIDAFPDTPVTGVVRRVQDSAAGEFTIFPASDEDPENPQKIDQYIPVRIELTSGQGLALVPGMNVTVHIRKD
jgi:multidrug resistance efflux pump